MRTDAPIDRDGSLASFQLLNKNGGPFTEEDEELLIALSSQAAISIENSKLYQSVVNKNTELVSAKSALEERKNELDILYQIEREIVEVNHIGELVQGILKRAQEIIGATKGFVGLREDNGRLRLMGLAKAETEANASIALGEGIIGFGRSQRSGGV